MTKTGLVAVLLAACPASAQIRSVSRIEFGPADTLFVADWKSANVHAISIPPAKEQAAHAFNLTDIEPALERELQTRNITVEDLRVRSGTGEVYLAVSYGDNASPAVVVVESDGSIRRVGLDHEAGPAIALQDPPTQDVSFWGRVPLRSLTVSAMRWHDGKLYIAGLSNQTFSSSLRVASYPGGSAQTISSVAIFHTSHGQIETRAPIRTMSFMTISGTDTLIAAYMCTPLVAIPVADIRDGAHITGKTIAELGYGNTPIDMVPFTAPDASGKPADFVLVTNVDRNAETISAASIAQAVERPGLDKLVPWSDIVGVDAVQAPIDGAIAIDNLDGTRFVLVRHARRGGGLQLVSVENGIKIRVSDYVSEYDFPSYSYSPGMQADTIKPIEDSMIKSEGFVSPTSPMGRGRTN